MTWISGTVDEDFCTIVIISYWVLIGMRNISQKCWRENQEAHFTFDNVSENHAVWEIMWKIWYSNRAHSWQCNMADALCMLDNEGYTHTHTHTHTFRICNSYFFFTRTLVARKHLNITLYVAYIAWLILLYNDTVHWYGIKGRLEWTGLRYQWMEKRWKEPSFFL